MDTAIWHKTISTNNNLLRASFHCGKFTDICCMNDHKPLKKINPNSSTPFANPHSDTNIHSQLHVRS